MQENQAKEYSVSNALPIHKVYKDDNTSAIKFGINDRKGLTHLLEDIKNGRVENLLVYKRDRLARKSEEYMKIYEILKEHKVRVHFTSASEYPMSYNNLSEFIELILSGMVEHEVKQMKERISH